MGICLDTDHQDGSQVFEEAGAQQNSERWRREAGILATPPGGKFPMQNAGTVNFEPPTVPVIFVLGGPGSGKVTHCDNLTQEKEGIVHINMTDLLQQYALGNDMQDFGLLSSKTVTEVLMLEMKMSLGAKTFLVSGYPRNMRDVVEYSEKIQIVNGVILVAWKQEMLERQIDYGAQLGQLIIELARMELQNFYKNVMPVAEYFDQSELLLVVNGERNPTEVYVDFRESVMRILGLTEDGRLPESQVPSSMEAEVDVVRTEDGEQVASPPSMRNNVAARNPSPSPPPARASPKTPISNSPPAPPPAPVQAVAPVPVLGEEVVPLRTADIPKKRLPPVVWVLGGPGSNKALVCQQAIRKMPNWIHLNVGSQLVTLASKNSKIKEQMTNGELVATEVVMLLVEKQILLNRDSSGIILDGFPRDAKQARDFENKFGQRPDMLLLDVSKLHTSRGRMYDGAESFERRLDLFRKLALPMLKRLDSEGRLRIVDGDTELPADRQQFASALLELMKRASRNEDDPNRISVLRDEDDAREIGTGVLNGMVKAIGNGIDHRGPAVTNGTAGGRTKPALQANGGPHLRTAARKVISTNRFQKQQQSSPHQNGKSTTAKKQQQRHMNGGAPQLLQNGVPPTMANGFLPTKNNKVKPANARQPNGAVTTISDPLGRMYSEIADYNEGGYDYPPSNLHI